MWRTEGTAEIEVAVDFVGSYEIHDFLQNKLLMLQYLHRLLWTVYLRERCEAAERI